MTWRMTWFLVPLFALGVAPAGALQHSHGGGAAPPPDTTRPATKRPAPPAVSAAGASAVPIAVHAEVSRSAMWVGDHIVFTVDVNCPPGLDVVVDDFAKEKLTTDGIDVLQQTQVATRTGRGGVRRRFRYELTTYEVGRPTVTLSEFSARYYRTNAASLGPAQTGELRVPGAVISLRSTMGEDGIATLRDTHQPEARPAWTRHLETAGLACIVLAAVPVIALGVRLGRRLVRWRPRKPKLSLRATRAAIERLKVGGFDGADARDGYAQLDGLVRDYLTHIIGPGAHALSASEAIRALEHRSAGVLSHGADTILVACERARFLPPDRAPGAADLRDVIERADALVKMAPR